MVSYSVPYLSDCDDLLKMAQGGLTLLRYKTPATAGLGAYRSVVYEGGNLVGFSTPKFGKLHECETLPFHELQARQYMDGTMVYAYFAENEWKVSTRGTLTAETVYRCGVAPPPAFIEGARLGSPRGATIKTLFWELADEVNLLNFLQPGTTYVFSLMHPEAFNVVKDRRLYFITAYTVAAQTAQRVDVPEWFPLPKPPLMLFESMQAVLDTVSGSGPHFKGIVLHHPPTDRFFKVMNEAFLRVHALLPYANLNKCLLQMLPKVNDLNYFLTLYPEHAVNVHQLRINLAVFANRLLDQYRQCFVFKQKVHRDFHPRYRGHMYNLHGIYLTKPERRSLRLCDVTQYLETCTVDSLCFLL